MQPRRGGLFSSSPLRVFILLIYVTTLGETAGDLLSMTLNTGYAMSSVILLLLFVVTLAIQLKSKEFHTVLFCSAVLSTCTGGTTMPDYMSRTLGLGYATGSLILLLRLAAVVALWPYSATSLSVDKIYSKKLHCAC